ncbi:S-layer family protein [Nostoc sp. TCL26-01]|uniref:beta strand repeat-containing protein n=1 Tax=Nostoc sp. TCL26-01 TaxID=2576904 RepID=UPI0015C13D49|nr:pre-peptidase C-terminal domain-containing protein [Nostoc sp. TCL26-01]QLE54146.1 pre-peptidase [Nostoc sp. TCL26-01]
MPSPYSGFPDPGSNTATALDTTSASYIGGSLTSTSNIFQDSLSSADRNDYYRFTVSSSSIVTLNLTGLAANSDADLYLLNSNGSNLKVASTSGNASESIRFTLNNQPANTSYYAQVYLVNSTVSTTYNLSLSAEAILDTGISDNSTTDANANRDISTSVNGSGYTATDFVGSPNTGLVQDSSDFYKFTLTNSGTVNINLTPSSGNADLRLLRGNGTTLKDSFFTGTTPDVISSYLASGTYYIRAYTSLDTTNYNLQVNFTADAPDTGGNTLAAATSITPPTTISDLVGTADNQDYYKFTLASSALVDIKFTSLSADANLFLQDQNGNNIQASAQSGTTLDFIRRSLNAGTYNILITAVSGVTSANYTLSVATQNIATDQAPNIGSAQNLGNLNGFITRNEFVGNIDINDYYKFTLGSTSNVNLNLSILSSYADTRLVNADVQILNSSNAQVGISNQAGNSSESISNLTLNAGTYYIRVYTINTAYDNNSINTFYTLDISAQGQVKKLEINPGAGSSNPSNLTALGNTLYFTSDDGGANGVQLWKSDGNTNTRLTNINGFNPSNLLVFNNKLYFTASNSTFGRELWEYNGTTASRISDINPNTGNSDPSNLTVVGSQLFLTAVDSSAVRKLWVYNGTTVSLADINPGFASSGTPTFTTAFNNRLLFTAQNNNQLWSTDGTVAGTQVINVGGVTNSTPRRLTVVGNTLYFTANNGTSGFEIWQYQSGTTASLVKDITAGNNSFAPDYLTAVGNTLYFVTDSNNDFNFELWKSDGTNSGTVRVKNNTAQAPNLGLGPINLTSVGNTLYFAANDPATGLELWKTDGTDANTSIIKDIWTGTNAGQPNNSTPTSLVNFNSTLAFAASDGTNREVWFSDGTASNTQKVSNIYATGIANPDKLTVVGTKLFFTATDGASGTELYVI